jgi:hypothetical protein
VIVMTELITYLHAFSWPGLVGILVLLLPKVLDKIRGIIHACTFRRLGKALVDKADWTKAKTVEGVLELMGDIDRHSAPGPGEETNPDHRPGAAEPPAP